MWVPASKEVISEIDKKDHKKDQAPETQESITMDFIRQG